MSSTTVDFIINNIELLDTNDLLIIKNELTQAFKIDNLGMECDRDEWCRLLEVINKQILILEYKNERK